VTAEQRAESAAAHPVTGIVLAGGRSSRMGRDKAFLKIGGQPLVERVIGRLQRLCRETIIVTNSPARYAYLPARLVSDVVPGRGPLVGIYSGLRAAQNDLAVVVACDMPFLNASLLQFMVAQAPRYDVVIPRTRYEASPRGLHRHGGLPTGRAKGLHPLHAVYRKTCLPPIERLIEENDLRVIAFFSQVRVRYVERHEIVRFDPLQRSFFNVNTPSDLDRALGYDPP